MNLLHLLQDKFHAALAGLVADPAPYAALVKSAQKAEHGDYQANCAMSLGKALGRKPREVADEIIARLDLGDMLETPEVAGPGFINLRIKPEWLARQLQVAAADERLGVPAASTPRNYVVDFSSPNVAKPLHVGHLRSTIIGDALTRLLRFLGHRVIADNHLGDWGTQFGMLLYGYKHFLNREAYQADPLRELARLYLHMRQLTKGADDDENKPADTVAKQYADACRAETAKLHAGDPENVRLWQEFMPACLEEIHAIYRRLDVHFDHEHGESFYNPMLPGVAADLLARRVAQESNGAVVIFHEGKPDESPSVIRKRDGAFTYTTSDLATIRYRMTEWHPDAMLYVVDARQALHFSNLFAAGRRWGYAGVEMQHISFGSVLASNRKPLSTREGGAIELGELLDEAVRRGADKYEQSLREQAERGGEAALELAAEEKQQIAEAVGLGAVKYADLSQHRTTDYVFNWDKMLATDGNTATYMQYAYARCRSIFRKGDEDPARFRTAPPLPTLASPPERALALQLLRFEETLTAAAAEYVPHLLTAYLWDLAKAYSVFFTNCPVLKAETPELRTSRLLLCDLTARTIQKVLELLGIRTVERM